MAKRGAKKGLKGGALESAIEAHADAPSPVAKIQTVLARAQEAFAGPGRMLALERELIDAAVLHLWDVGSAWGKWPAWTDDAFASLTERGGFFIDDEGETTLATLGMEMIVAHAGRAIDAPPPSKCACSICQNVTDGRITAVVEFLPIPTIAEMMSGDYRRFLESKIKLAPFEGIEPLAEINPALAPHARAIVRWALKGGRRAVFASFGLHKTATQIEIMRQIANYEPGSPLIVLPLGVRQEFTSEASERFTGDYAVRLVFIRTDAEFHDDAEARQRHADLGVPTIYLSNYESVREGKLDPRLFIAASLDEAAVLRSFGSKTYQEFLPLFEGVRFRFVATATPSPNRLKELIHYAGFLGVMDTGHALTRFFQRNSEKANDLTLYPHKEEEFWIWVQSWSVWLQKPSDLGFSDEGFNLPPLDVRWHEVPTDHKQAGEEKDGQKLLFRDAALGVQAAAAEKRDSLPSRVAKMLELRAEQAADHVVLWHDLEAEREAIEAALGDGVVTIHGSMDLDERERRVIAFAKGEIATFATKPILSGAGCNFQRHCAWEIFVGVGFKFHDFIQAIHRVQRFGQKRPCRIDIIYSEAERLIVADLKRKWQLHDEMQTRMAELIRRFGLDHEVMVGQLTRTMGVERREARGERYWIANNDCVAEARAMDDNSVDLIVSSIPFSSQYEYCEAYEDFGHVDTNEEFFGQMSFLTRELLRVLKPGRRCEIHVKDRIVFGAVAGTGAPTVYPFHADTIRHFQAAGFDYMGMVTVVTDVVRENNQTYRLGWTENAKDATKMGSGMPEYILHFRKPQSDRSKGYADDPVAKPKKESADGAWINPDGYSRARWQIDAHAFWRSSGNRLISVEELARLGPDKLAKAFTSWSLTEVYDYDAHVHIGEELEKRGALPATFMSIAPGSHHPEVWHDINRMLTLNSEQSRRRVEMHVCPLQLDIVERLITMYSQAGELVFDPFAGLGTVPYVAVKKGRRGAGSELNPQSFRDACYYLGSAEREAMTPTLFGLLGAESEADAESSSEGEAA